VAGDEPLRLRVAGGVARVTLDHPPINLLDLELLRALDGLTRELADDGDVRVVVVDSAVPGFWVAHADVELLLRLPVEVAEAPAEELSFFHALVERLRTLPKPTIAVIEGCCRGGGSELALAFDLRYGALGRAVLGQPEVSLGIVPGGGATQRLPRLLGRDRALEVVLGGADVDAATAERWGWLTRALPPDDLRPFVDALAARLASLPPETVALAKVAVDEALGSPVDGLRVEDHLFRRTLATDEARRRMGRFLERGGQTAERERDLGWVAVELADG